MIGLEEFVRETVERSGGAADQCGDGRVEAILPESVKNVLDCGEHVLLRLDGRSGGEGVACGYGTDALSALAGIAIGGGRVAACRVDAPGPKLRLPERFSGINASVREIGVSPGLGWTLVAKARYTASCDEMRSGLVSAAVIVPEGVSVPAPDFAALPLEACGSDRPDAGALAGTYPWLVRGLMREAARELALFREAVARRHGRDARRVERYFEEVAADLGRRMASRPGHELEAKLAGLPEERKRRRQQLEANFSLRVRIDVVGLVAVQALGMTARLEARRRRHVRLLEARWDGLCRAWTGLRCDGCGTAIFQMAVCDGGRHVLCDACWAACGEGGKRPCFVCAGRLAAEPWKVVPAGDIQETGPARDPGPGGTEPLPAQPVNRQAVRQAVQGALERSGEWMTSSAIRKAATLDVTTPLLRQVLDGLVKQGIAAREGRGRGTRYRFAYNSDEDRT